MTFFLVGRSWRRRDPDGFGVWVARNGDTSPAVECNSNYLPGHSYNIRCSCCWLGHSHSRELHDRNLTEYAALHQEA